MSEEAKDLVRRVMELRPEWSPYDVAEALDNRVSGRTIYRWLKGESIPGNPFDQAALEKLVERLQAEVEVTA